MKNAKSDSNVAMGGTLQHIFLSVISYETDTNVYNTQFRQHIVLINIGVMNGFFLIVKDSKKEKINIYIFI